jgi:TrmH family RNA methyltransferase
MFPLAKLGELSPRTRLRKAARILQAVEMDVLQGRGFDAAYLRELARLVGRAAPQVSDAAFALAGSLAAASETSSPLRAINGLRHAVLALVGAEPSEWDLLGPGTGLLDRTGVHTAPVAAYLEDIRSPFNVGSLFRTAEAFGAERLYLSPRTPLPTHPRARKTARGAEDALPWEVCELSGIPAEGVFALELGGTPLQDFAFPRRGIVLVGSEELGLSPEALALADRALGRVSIPLAGAKRSLNVSVAFGILMSRWLSALSSSSASSAAQR